MYIASPLCTCHFLLWVQYHLWGNSMPVFGQMLKPWWGQKQIAVDSERSRRMSYTLPDRIIKWSGMFELVAEFVLTTKLEHSKFPTSPPRSRFDYRLDASTIRKGCQRCKITDTQGDDIIVINSLWTGDHMKRPRAESSLVQAMVWHLQGAKPLLNQ